MKTPETVIKELELGYIPNELLFLAPEEQIEEVEIDWTAMHYSDWDDFDFWCAKHLPVGLLEQWPCLEDWARQEYESREKKTPLDELNERQNILAEDARAGEASSASGKEEEQRIKMILYDI